MEIVIKIPEGLKDVFENRNVTALDVEEMRNAIKNGIPLPKGHGNLIDYDDLIAQLDRYGRKNVIYQLPYSPTIIFEDKEVNADASD